MIVSHDRPKTWNLDCAKTPGFDDRNGVNIRNMDPVTIVESGEFSRESKSKFLTDRGITLEQRNRILSRFTLPSEVQIQWMKTFADFNEHFWDRLNAAQRLQKRISVELSDLSEELTALKEALYSQWAKNKSPPTLQTLPKQEEPAQEKPPSRMVGIALLCALIGIALLFLRYPAAWGQIVNLGQL